MTNRKNRDLWEFIWFQSLVAVGTAFATRNLVVGISMCATGKDEESIWSFANAVLLIATSAPFVIAGLCLQVALIVCLIFEVQSSEFADTNTESTKQKESLRKPQKRIRFPSLLGESKRFLRSTRQKRALLEEKKKSFVHNKRPESSEPL